MKVTLTTITTQTKISEDYPEILNRFNLTDATVNQVELWETGIENLADLANYIYFIGKTYGFHCYTINGEADELRLVIDDFSILEDEGD